MEDGIFTDRQEMFCREYIIDFNASRAAKAAGYSDRSAGQIGHDNLKKPEIQKYLKQLMQERSGRVGVTADMVVQELKLIAFGDPRKIIKWSGDTADIKDSDELNKDEIAMVGGVVHKKGKYGNTVEIKFNDKISALDKLARHLGIYENDTLHVKTEHIISDENKAILERLGIKADDEPI